MRQIQEGSGLTLEAMESKCGMKLSKNELWRLANGLPIEAAGVAVLDNLAAILDLPEPLLYEFLIPTSPGAVAVRKHEALKFVRGGLTYLLPKRKLMLSDITIERVVIPAKHAQKQDVQHPSYEFLMPISGTVNLVIAGVRSELSVGEYAHYLSSRPHRIDNTSDSDSEVFFIRFYGAAHAYNCSLTESPLLS